MVGARSAPVRTACLASRAPSAGSSADCPGAQAPRARRAGRRGRRAARRRRPRAARISAWMVSVTSQTLTFMPATTRSPASQKAMNSRLAGSPRKTTRSQLGAKPGVLHADVVLVGEEVRQAVVRRAARRACCARRPGPGSSALAQCSTRMRCAVERVLRRWRRRRRRRRPARCVSQVLVDERCRRRRRARPPRRARCAAATPTPTTTKSQSSVRPSLVRTPLDAPRRPRTPRRRCRAAARTPWSVWTSR